MVFHNFIWYRIWVTLFVRQSLRWIHFWKAYLYNSWGFTVFFLSNKHWVSSRGKWVFWILISSWTEITAQFLFNAHVYSIMCLLFGEAQIFVVSGISLSIHGRNTELFFTIMIFMIKLLPYKAWNGHLAKIINRLSATGFCGCYFGHSFLKGLLFNFKTGKVVHVVQVL